MPAPKGNKFAVGNSGGWKKFETVEELESAINGYFKECNNNILKIYQDGNHLREPYTIEGLALALGCTYQTLLNYEKASGYEEFFESIKKAKLKIQKDKVVNMLSGISNVTGSIFDLKNNHGYKDQSVIDQNINLGIAAEHEKYD